MNVYVCFKHFFVIICWLRIDQRVGYELTESAYETSEPGYESSGNVISEKSVCVSLKFVPYLRIVCLESHFHYFIMCVKISVFRLAFLKRAVGLKTKMTDKRHATLADNLTRGGTG